MTEPTAGAGVVDRFRAPLARRSTEWYAGLLHYASLVVGFLYLVWVDRHQWFSGDEWDILVKRGIVGQHALGLFEPHNEHWVTVPILIYRALFSVFGVRTYLPYLVVLFLFQLLVAHLLWRLMLRAGVAPMLATAAAAVFLVIGAGWEDLVNAFQITFVAPVALGLLALLLMPERGPFQRRDAYGWVCNILALMCSGVGLTMLLVVGTTALLRRGWRVALAVVSLPAVVYLLWYAKWGHHVTAVEQQPLGTAIQQAPAFVWRGLVDAVDAATGLTGVAPVLLVLLAIWLVWVARPFAEPWPVLLTLAIGAPVFLFLINIRRSGLGVAAAGAPRYGYVVIALLVPVVALASTRLVAGRPLAVSVSVGLVATAVLLLVSVSTVNLHANEFAVFKQENKQRIVAAAGLLARGADVLSPQPSPEYNPDLTASTLRALARNGDLPGNVHPSAVERLTASEFLQIAAGSSASPGAGAVPTIVGTEGATVAPASTADCVSVTGTSDQPVVLLQFPAPGSVTVTPSRSGTITAQLQAPEPGSTTRGRGRSFPATGGQALVVSVAATKPWLRLGVPADGSTELCHVVDQLEPALQPAA